MASLWDDSGADTSIRIPWDTLIRVALVLLTWWFAVVTALCLFRLWLWGVEAWQ